MGQCLIELSRLHSPRMSEHSVKRRLISIAYEEGVDQRQPERHQQHKHNDPVPVRLEKYVEELLVVLVQLHKNQHRSHLLEVATAHFLSFISVGDH